MSKSGQKRAKANPGGRSRKPDGNEPIDAALVEAGADTNLPAETVLMSADTVLAPPEAKAGPGRRNPNSSKKPDSKKPIEPAVIAAEADTVPPAETVLVSAHTTLAPPEAVVAPADTVVSAPAETASAPVNNVSEPAETLLAPEPVAEPAYAISAPAEIVSEPVTAVVSTSTAVVSTATAVVSTATRAVTVPANTLSSGIQTIAAAYGDFTRKSLEDTKCFVEKLASVRSFDKAVEVHAEYARTACETFIAESQKIRALYSDLARQTFKPFAPKSNRAA